MGERSKQCRWEQRETAKKQAGKVEQQAEHADIFMGINPYRYTVMGYTPNTHSSTHCFRHTLTSPVPHSMRNCAAISY